MINRRKFRLFIIIQNSEIMKSRLLIILLVILPSFIYASEDEHQVRKKSEWFEHIDQRLTNLEDQLEIDLALVHRQQDKLNEEMDRLNSKLESRFDKYFLWGYGTLLVVISTLTSVIFNKRKSEKASNTDISKMAELHDG